MKMSHQVHPDDVLGPLRLLLGRPLDVGLLVPRPPAVHHVVQVGRRLGQLEKKRKNEIE